MNVESLTRPYLETLSFADLSSLADEYGIDVPENLNRRFLIAELLEVVEEANDEEDEMIISSNVVFTEEAPKPDLPKNYNETQISCVLRNPTWMFVFWNISESDSIMLKKLGTYELMLRVCILKDSKDPMPEEVFEIQATTDSQEQYILLPTGKKFIKVELVYQSLNTGKVLAFSPVVSIPQGSSLVEDLQMGRDTNFPEIIQLSGMEKVLRDQYKKHRHSNS